MQTASGSLTRHLKDLTMEMQSVYDQDHEMLAKKACLLSTTDKSAQDDLIQIYEFLTMFLCVSKNK